MHEGSVRRARGLLIGPVQPRRMLGFALRLVPPRATAVRTHHAEASPHRQGDSTLAC